MPMTPPDPGLAGALLRVSVRWALPKKVSFQTGPAPGDRLSCKPNPGPGLSQPARPCRALLSQNSDQPRQTPSDSHGRGDAGNTGDRLTPVPGPGLSLFMETAQAGTEHPRPTASHRRTPGVRSQRTWPRGDCRPSLLPYPSAGLVLASQEGVCACVCVHFSRCLHMCAHRTLNSAQSGDALSSTLPHAQPSLPPRGEPLPLLGLCCAWQPLPQLQHRTCAPL